MVKIAIAVDGEDTYPIYRVDSRYVIDMGAGTGISDPMSFPSDTKAISFLQGVIECDPTSR